MQATQSYQVCDVREMAAKLAESGDVQLIDVREPAEYRALRFSAARNHPLSRLKDGVAELDPERPVYVLCRSGRRAETAAEQLLAAGVKRVHVVTGGILACQDAGLPLEMEKGGVWCLERQVRFTAGLLVLAGVGLGFAVHPGFFGLAGFVGAGLTFAGMTDTCAMAMLLARMPWNQQGGTPAPGASGAACTSRPGA